MNQKVLRNTLMLIIVLVFPLAVLAQSLEWNGLLRYYTAVRLQEDHDYLSNRNQLVLKALYNYGESQVYTALEFEHDKLEATEEIQIELREAFGTFYFEHADVRVGRQVVAWGNTDGLIITDIITPKDLSEFITQDFDDIRLAEDMLRLNLYGWDTELELIAIPTFRGHELPSFDSPWTLFSADSLTIPNPFDPLNPIDMLPLPSDPAQLAETPPANLKNSEWGLRLFHSFATVDLAGYFFRGRDNLPVLSTQPVDITIIGTIPVTVEVPVLRYPLLTMAGGSFSTGWNRFVVRGEGAYFWNKRWTTHNLLDNGSVRADEVDLLVGVDLDLGSWGIASGQYYRRYILDAPEPIREDDLLEIFTLLLERSFWREKLRLSAFGYASPDDVFLRFSGSYALWDGVNSTFGIDLLEGDTNGIFGRYRDNDYAYLRVEFNF